VQPSCYKKRENQWHVPLPEEKHYYFIQCNDELFPWLWILWQKSVAFRVLIRSLYSVHNVYRVDINPRKVSGATIFRNEPDVIKKELWTWDYKWPSITALINTEQVKCITVSFNSLLIPWLLKWHNWTALAETSSPGANRKLCARHVFIITPH
jgi:hypothetical protein